MRILGRARQLLSVLRNRIDATVMAEDGPLTRELLRDPGRFGLGQVPARLAPEATTTLVCGYCATGCGLDVHLRDGEAVNLSPALDHPVNGGMACPKGWEALSALDCEDRAITPLLRSAGGKLEPVDWQQALDVFVSRFQEITEREGGDACAFLSTGQIPSEEMLFLGALGRFGMGFGHGDGNTRQCMATAATAYKESFGFDAPPYSYEDFEESDVIVLVGSNLCIAHPILWERICQNPHDPAIVVVDPRKTETATAATHHYAIEPKSDLAFFYSVAHVLIREGWIDRRYLEAHTEGFEGFGRFLADYSPEAVAGDVGVTAAAIEELAGLIQQGKRVSFWWTMGVNQGHQAVRVAQVLIDLALLTGNMGRPGTGANSITGQCNAMGSRLFSNTTGLPAGRSFSDEGDRREVAEALGMPLALVSDTDSLAYDEIIAGIHSGRIKGLWIIATNTAHSWIHKRDLQAALDRLEFLVVQDMYSTSETARRADLVLPAAGWGEKDGTFINSERRVGLVKKVRRAPGQALADFHIFRLIADAWGCGALFERWKTPEDVFDAMRALSRGRPCDISGIEGYAMLEAEGGIQWPCPEGSSATDRQKRLFEDGRFYRANGRARIVFETPAPVPEPVDKDFPLVLLTGRGSSSQWHTQTRTGKSAVLRKLHRADPYVEISPADAERFGLRDDDEVSIRSRRGAMRAAVTVRPSVAPGQIFVPMHYSEVNLLTFPAFDPHSRQPSYKHCAVRVERAVDGADCL